MKRKQRLTVALMVGSLAAGTLPTLAVVASEDGATAQQTISIEATDARLVRKVTGDVVADVQGVPAEPVDSFVWDGDGLTPIDGTVKLDIDPVANTGKIVANWTDENGSWEFVQTAFMAPPHPTGLRVGPSATGTELVEGDPVTTNVYLHGDTGAGGEVLPTEFNLLATWGVAEVTLNGEPFNNPYDGPAPLWAAHTMTSVGVRDSDDGTVRTVDGEIFDPRVDPANGRVDNDDLEFHLVFEDAPGPEMTTNFPPPLSFFYHVSFEDVTVDIASA